MDMRKSTEPSPSLLVYLTVRFGYYITSAQKDICNFIYQPKQTVHSALKKLVKDGLIEIGDYNGKRHKYVVLTEKGEEFSRKTVDLVLAEEIAAFEDMDASERELSIKLLAKYSDSLSQRMSKFR